MARALKFIREDRDNFRVYYRDETTRAIYCTQPASHLTYPQYKETGETELLRCSQDGEPSHVVKKELFELN